MINKVEELKEQIQCIIYIYQHKIAEATTFKKKKALTIEGDEILNYLGEQLMKYEVRGQVSKG
jgi:hypothetical protein